MKIYLDFRCSSAYVIADEYTRWARQIRNEKSLLFDFSMENWNLFYSNVTEIIIPESKSFHQNCMIFFLLRTYKSEENKIKKVFHSRLQLNSIKSKLGSISCEIKVSS